MKFCFLSGMLWKLEWVKFPIFTSDKPLLLLILASTFHFQFYGKHIDVHKASKESIIFHRFLVKTQTLENHNAPSSRILTHCEYLCDEYETIPGSEHIFHFSSGWLRLVIIIATFCRTCKNFKIKIDKMGAYTLG